MFIIDKKEFKYTDTDSNEIQSCLDPGLYDIKIHRSMFGKSISFSKSISHIKGSIAEAGVFKKVKDYLSNYYSDAAKICRKEMNLPSRIGLLFKGDPGTGKTFMACKLSQYLVEKENAIVVLTNEVSDLDLPEIVDILRKNNDPDRMIIFIWDEFEKDWDNCNKKNILSFLDGTNSRDNVLVIATVNDEKKLPDTLLNRPGRFELVEHFSIESEEIALNIITAMTPEHRRSFINTEEIYSNLGKNFTIDNIKVAVRNKVTELIQKELDTANTIVINNQSD